MATDATISEPEGGPAASPDTAAPPRNSRRAAIAGGAGTLIEGYDFSSYGYLSVFIAPLFFPNNDPVVSLLLTLMVFAAAYLARPLGGIALGLVGDRVDRGKVLVATILLMGVATTLIGLLPTTSTIGVTATVLLIVLRLVQGFSVGAEVAGAATFVSEAAPDRFKSRFGAFNPAGATFGFGLAAAIAGLTSALTTADQMAEWGWRIPFLLSLPLTVVCFLIRRRITGEAHPVAKIDGKKTSLLDVIRVGWRAILKGAGLSAAVNGTAYFGLTYVSIHLIQRLEYPKTAVYWVTTAVVMITALLMLPVGRLGDRVDLPRLGAIGMVGYLAVTWVAMWLMGFGSLALAGVAFLAIMVNSAFLQVTGYSLSPEIYPRAIRFTGTSLGWNLGVIIAGGTAPALCVWLVETTGNPTSPAFFVMLAAAIGLVSVWAIARGPRPGRAES
ncbi:MFS transporter [Pseudonocardia kujensis]|uniref:MFS transporter n=1 Tax=Pseudonocardia kujensis TaxID=1128675 RepID=UPI001E4B0161|nr:MFS transporter [Pseudonocardia kujensis]MCE0761992.1 MFS transporter [Pseudonocardia kujensis]